LFVSQPGGVNGGWVFELSARVPDVGNIVVRRVTLTNTFRAAARIIATATFPGATSWAATAYPPSGVHKGIRAGLVAQDSPFAPPPDDDRGQPGSKGWSYAITAVVNVPVGALVKEIAAVGGAGASSCQLTVPRDATSADALPAIPIAAGQGFSLPRATCEGLIGPVVVTFVGTAEQSVVWLE
jgi:hypothetical protein